MGRFYNAFFPTFSTLFIVRNCNKLDDLSILNSFKTAKQIVFQLKVDHMPYLFVPGNNAALVCNINWNLWFNWTQ